MSSRADSLVWDANGITAGNGGNGNWTGGNTWSNATALTTFAPWVDGNAAVITATSTITNSGSIIVTAITNTGGNPAQIVGTGVNSIDFGAGGLFVSPGNTTTLRTSSKLKGVVTFVPTSGTLAQAIALWVKADNTNLTSFTLAPTVPLGSMLADDAGAFGPAATSSLLITNRGIVTLGAQASEIVGNLPGISNPNGISYNAVPTTMGSGYIRSRFGTNTWNGPITLTANDSGFITRGSATVMLRLASTATIDLSSYTLQLNVDSASAGLFLNGSISGTGGITTVGTGTITSGANGTGVTTLNASNSFSGVALTAQNLGTIALNHTNALHAATLDTGVSGSQQVTFVIAGNNTYNLGALTGSDALAIGGNTLSVGAAGANTTFSAIISGSGGSLKNIGGVLTLDAANTYDGLTTISGGALALGASGSLASGSSVSIASGTTFDVSTPGTYTHGASASLIASGTASVPAVIFGGTTVDLGSRPVTLNCTPDTFTGDSDSPALNISQGALTINGAITVVNNGASPLDAGSYVLISQASGTITGTPTLSGTVGGLGLVGGNSAIITNTGTTINLVVQGALPTTTTLTRAAGTGSTTTYGDTLSFDISVSPALASGTVELRDGGPSGTLLGSGTLVGGTNTITPADNALTAGSHPNIVALYLGDVNYQASSSTALSTQTVTNKPLTVSGIVADSKYFDFTTAATLSGGTLNDVESGDTVTLNQTGTFASAGPGTGIAVTSTSTLGGAAAANYILTQPTGLSADIYASAVWTGTAGDTFWNTSLNWLTNVVPNGVGVIADFTQLDITTAQTVNLNAARTVGHLSFSDTDTNTPAGWTLANNGSGGNILTLAGTAPSVTVSDLGTNTVTISAVVAGSAGLTKAGAGTLALTGANTYTGGTFITNGILNFNNEGNLGTLPGIATPSNIVLNGGSLALVTANQNVTATRGVALGVNGGTLSNAVVAGGNLTVSGVIAGPGTLTLGLVSSAGLILNGQNTYTGGTSLVGPASATAFTTISSVGSPGSLVSGPFGTGTVTFNGPGTRSTLGSDTVNGNAIIFAADTTFPTIAAEKSLTFEGLVTLSSNRTLTVNVGATVAGKSVTFTNVINDGGNNYNLNKAGTGLLVLSGPSTYGGGTFVSAGTLQVNNTAGSGTGTGPVIVSNSATLGGTGTIGGAVTLTSGCKLAPGASVGTLTVSSLTLASGSTLNFEFTPVTGTPNDLVAVSTAGGLTLNGGAINLYESGGTVGFTNDGTYNLFAYSGALNGSLNNLSIANPQPGKSYVVSADGSNVKVTIGTAPAPVYWGVDADGSWGDALNWSPNTVPSAQFATANFGGVGSPAFTAARVVTLDGNKTNGTVNFDAALGFTINQGSGGSLQLDNGSGQALVSQTNGNNTINAPVTLPLAGANFSIAATTTLSAPGAVGGSGGLTKSSSGTLVLSGVNTYSGLTTASAGYLVVSNNAALGSTAGATATASGGAVELAHGIVLTGETITVNGFGPNARGALQSGTAATNEWAGPVILGAGAADSRVGAQADGALILSGVISGGAINNLIVSADHISGRVIVSGTANTYTGESQIIRGTLELGAHNALPVGTVLNVDAGSSVGDNGAFEMNGFNQQVVGIRRPNTGGDYSVKNSSGTLSTLTVNNTNNYTFPNTLTGTTVIEGNLALTKSGSGTLTLNSANTYTGNTTISAGNLTLSGGGTISGTPLITVNSNATFDVTGIGFILGETQTLAGSGTVLGDVTANGIIIPGSSIGTLTFSNNLTINSNLVFELNKSHPQSNDVIAVVGALNNTGVGTLTVTNLGPALAVNDSFKLFSQAVVGGLGLTITGPAGVTFTNNLEVDGSIAVLTIPGGGPVIPTTPTNITFTATGSNLTIGWPSNYVGWILQSQTNLRSVGLKTNWFNVAGSDATNTMTFPVNKTDPTVFFRLARTNQP